MHLSRNTPADPLTDAGRPGWIPPALVRFADECSATFGGALLYVGALALLAIGGVHLWHHLPEAIDDQPAIAASWDAASRTFPALTGSLEESLEKTNAYEAGRQPGSGAPAVVIATPVTGWLAEDQDPRLRGGL